MYYFHTLQCVSVQCVFPCYPDHDMFQFSMYFCAILSLCCFSSACIFMLSFPSYVWVQHVFWRFACDVFSSACISMLSSPSAVFQFSVYFRTILSMLCFSSACILVLSSWCVQCISLCYPLLMLCFSSVCISVLSSPCAVSHFSVYFCTILSKLFQFSMYFGAILMMCSVRMRSVSVQRVFSHYPVQAVNTQMTWRAGPPKLLRTTLKGQLCVGSITLSKVASFSPKCHLYVYDYTQTHWNWTAGVSTSVTWLLTFLI